MDNVSHSLVGLALSRAGLNRLTPQATFLLLLAANIPDIDIVALSKGQLAYLEAHRGMTHSLVAMPILAVACVLLVAALCRRRLPWLQAWLVCLAGLASHLLLDWTNDYGIRLLVPFSPEWFHLDLNSLTDGVILALLALAAVWPWLSGLVSGEIGDARKSPGRGIAIAMLLLCLGYDVGRFTLHTRAIAQLDSRLYGGITPAEVAALPTALNPFHWRGVVVTQSELLQFSVNPFAQFNADAPELSFRVPPAQSTANARRTPQFAYFLYFSRFPVWSLQPVTLTGGTGQRIDLTDLRFGRPGAGSFHCIAVEDPAGKILGSWFTFGSGAELGWSDPRSQ